VSKASDVNDITLIVCRLIVVKHLLMGVCLTQIHEFSWVIPYGGSA
jgi:hypothetical protein